MRFSLLGITVAFASLLVACGASSQPQGPTAPMTAEYMTIIPDESTYPAPTPPKEPARVDEHEDIMASILAIPPGQ